MKRILAPLLVLAMVAVACTSQNGSVPDAGGGDGAPATIGAPGAGTGGSSTGGTGEPVGLFASALQRFDTCEAFLAHVKAEAIERVGPYGLEGGGYFGGPILFEEAAAAEGGFDAAAPATTVAAQRSPVEGVDYSGTNVQEIGVDEPDIIKTDGERIVALAQGTLHYFDVTAEGPVARGSMFLESGWNQEMLLAGHKLLVMSTASRFDIPLVAQRGVFAPDYGGGEISAFVEIDISDPDDLEVVRRVYVDGRYVSARMTGDTARVVFASFPTGLEFLYPAGGGLRGEQRAIEVNREVIEESTIDNWVPYYIVEDGRGNVVDEGNLLDCENAYYPAEFAGFTMLSVLTMSLEDGVDPTNSVGVLAGGETLYASPDALYVASQRWVPWETLDEAAARREAEVIQTHIHKFDISDPNRTTYQASGSVRGFMLNQFAMSEHDGYLRVATTDQPSWFWWGDSRASESQVAVLEQDGDELVQVGSVGGLGRGEQIFAVRFLGDVGYVVTFRQVDPLYTIDLSDPANPIAVGELKIPGFSSYLHPVEDGLLLGVGQDATEEGFTRGTQVSLFDVSDLANPIRLQQWTMPRDENGSSSSEVEYDHRAFLHWPATGTTVLPISRWSWDERTQTEDNFFGAVAVEATRDGIEEIGRITHDRFQGKDGQYDWGAQVRRSLVIGDSLYTLSEIGLMASDLSSLETQGVVYFDGFIPEVLPVEPDAAAVPVEEGVTDTTLGG